MSESNELRIGLRTKVKCLHCWDSCKPEQLKWIAVHQDLLGDPLLGDEAYRRFTPSRFDASGHAIDPRGASCRDLACPECHLRVPRDALHLAPLIVSVAGTPSCGKSYLLAAMTRALRSDLPAKFSLAFSESDPEANLLLNHYEAQQFLNADPDALVRLAKTEEQGDNYHTIRKGEQIVQLPKPFLFSVKPTAGHPSRRDARRRARLLALYDNAGESFLPGKDTADNRATGHLWRSDAVAFLYDPTQDTRFRSAYQQLPHASVPLEDAVTARQETILHEIAGRVDRHTTHADDHRSRPLLVVLTKYDQWWPLVGHERLPTPIIERGEGKLSALHLGMVQHVSDAARKLLQQFTPEVVTTAEEMSDNVWYVPVSATGCSPEKDPETGRLGFRPRSMKPMWESVPMLLAMALRTRGLIPVNDQPIDSAAASEVDS